LQQAPNSYRKRQHSQEMNPAMRDRQGAPDADQADAKDRGKPKVLTGHNSSSRDPPRKKQSQEKGIIDIRCREGCDARRQYAEMSVHLWLRLS
jgi:hypothetical protein